jgi:hypothetical protein
MIGIYRYDHMIHFYRRNHIEKNYGMNSKMKIFKFSYLNFNTCKEVQIFWAMVTVDIDFQYLPYTKGIN